MISDNVLWASFPQLGNPSHRPLLMSPRFSLYSGFLRNLHQLLLQTLRERSRSYMLPPALWTLSLPELWGRFLQLHTFDENFHSSFRSRHSTRSVLLRVNNDILAAMDNKSSVPSSSPDFNTLLACRAWYLDDFHHSSLADLSQRGHLVSHPQLPLFQPVYLKV